MPQGGRMRLLELRPPRVAHAFAALALAFGTLWLLATPPFDAPDEPRHLQRAWLLSQGRIAVPGSARGTGGAIPASLTRLHPPYTYGTSGCRHRSEELLARLAIPLALERTSDEIRTPILYGPIGYLPQALALAPARWLGVTAGGVLYIARLANLITWTGLCALAIGCAPARRWALASAALLPMSLFEASTVSGDAVTNALALLLLALVLRGASSASQRATRWELAAILGVVALLGLGKPGYSLLALLTLAIGTHRFERAGQRRSFVAAALALGVVVPGAWWASVQQAGPFPYPNADPVEQLAGLGRAPWRLLEVIATSLGERAFDYVRGTIGVLGRLDVMLPSAAYLGYGLLLAVVALTDRSGAPRLARRARAVVGLVAVVGAAAIVALLYVSATPPGAARVTAVQGRYFLPFVPLGLVALPTLREFRPAAGWWLVVGWGAGLAATSYAIWLRYYGV